MNREHQAGDGGQSAGNGKGDEEEKENGLGLVNKLGIVASVKSMSFFVVK